MKEEIRNYEKNQTEMIYIPKIVKEMEKELGPIDLSTKVEFNDDYEEGYSNESIIIETLQKLLTMRDPFIFEVPTLTEMRIQFAKRCMKEMESEKKSLFSSRVMDIAEEMYYIGFLDLYRKMARYSDLVKEMITIDDPGENSSEYPSVANVRTLINRFRGH